jgi:hypothetical protein
MSSFLNQQQLKSIAAEPFFDGQVVVIIPQQLINSIRFVLLFIICKLRKFCSKVAKSINKQG